MNLGVEEEAHMKRLGMVLIGILVGLGCGWAESEKLKIAILRIENRSGISVDTDALTESFQFEMVNKRYFLVVERSQLNKVLEEQKLSLSGLTEEEQATQVGQLLGAQKIWTGSLSRFGDKYVLTMKSIDAKTGVIDFADQVYTYDEGSIIDVIPDLADRMVKLAQGKTVPKYEAKKKPAAVVTASRQSTASSRVSSYSDRPDSSFEIGFYSVRFGATNEPASTNLRAGGFSLMMKNPADQNFEWYFELRGYSGNVTPQWDVSGVMLATGLGLNLLANGYVLLGATIGIGLDFPQLSFSNSTYKISCMEGVLPLGLQFGVHLGKHFMLVFEFTAVPGFGLSIADSTYPTSLPGTYIESDGDSYYVPNELSQLLKDGFAYSFGGIRLSFLF